MKVAGWSLSNVLAGLAVGWAVLLGPAELRAQEAAEPPPSPQPAADTEAVLAVVLADPIVSGAVAGFETLHAGLVVIERSAEVSTETYEDGGTSDHVIAQLTYNSPQGADVWTLTIDGHIAGGTFWLQQLTVGAVE
jgi:hypothetical protein